ICIDILLPRNDIHSLIREKAFPFKSILKAILKRERPRWISLNRFNEQYYRDAFTQNNIETNLTFIKSKSSAFYSYFDSSDCDVILPCMRVPSGNLNKKAWIGYIYDFQHCYYPSFFSKREIDQRNVFFKLMLNCANNIIVNAHSVITDANKYVGNYSAKLHSLPFSPCPQLKWFADYSGNIAKYNIDKDYFIICNQFWKHKDHATAFRAFKIYTEYNPDVYLVCTGATQDYRFPGYFNELMVLAKKLGIESKIKILGHIPKLEQIELIKNCIAVIQPTLFEGGPGGGVTFDAIALGKKVILSDIDVNKEVNCGDVYFFQAKNHYSLNDAMVKADESKIFYEPTTLIELGLKRRNACADFLLDVVKQEIESRS
ncbi:TPA: glycosyltransferase family 4 protein, partial [Escherichia coli]|nr:glycosyltransferase family 4 protein [Escherichia coli O157:H7]EES4859028.1 glycosyltransferase family 4 protein [Escherichia coli]EEW8363915.1 glycosyltransferase family 4 protein [Escherichia coli]EFC2344594.1 glycosyltransferase family 4 protein [Escherichia coli]EFD6736732.1 glycosyltransferase family 4 protein [Escherichia coli]